MLILGAALMAAAGLVFASTAQWWLLLVAGTIGVISPSGHEVGPFLSIEQAALSQTITNRTRTTVFAWYTLVGSLATAAGALAGGTAVRVLQQTPLPPVSVYRAVVLLSPRSASSWRCCSPDCPAPQKPRWSMAGY
jgi:MFS family permease